MNKKSLLLTGLIVVLLGTTPVIAASPNSALTVPVGGNFVDAAGGNGTFKGEFRLVQFAAENNQLVARGFISGILTDSTGRVLGSAMKEVAVPVAVNGRTFSSTRRVTSASLQVITTATCSILHLDLGPLNLNLLGLNVDLSQVILDITAQTGAGNLLGNLLCAVTGLLDGVGTLLDLVNLLNQILQAIGNILN